MRAKAQRDETLKQKKDESMSRMMKDLAVDRERNPAAAAADQWDPEEEDEEEDGGDISIIDRSTFYLLCSTSCDPCLLLLPWMLFYA